MDTLFASLPIHAGVSPDWNALDQALDAMSADALTAFEPDLYSIDPKEVDPEQMRARLRKVATAVRSAIEGGSRELDVLTVPGWRIYVTGGASWGDAPTDLFEHFRDLSITGLAEAAGFHIDPDSETSYLLSF